MKKIKVAILGATGAVGQRFISLLKNHPYFEILDLLASKKSANKYYESVVNWILDEEIPKNIRRIKVKECKIENVSSEVKICFSALPSDIAKIIEPKFAKQGFLVFSNASSFRMKKFIPLVIPEINFKDFNLIYKQKKFYRFKGAIITNPNCTSTILSLALAPLLKFKIKSCIVSTMQALSGAGYPGVASLDIIDNIIPYIKNEEEKVESEPLKILSSNFKISASCHRVNVKDGHLEDVRISFKNKVKLEEIILAWKNFKGKPQTLNLPSAPKNPIIFTKEFQYPQPRKHRMAGNGMSIVIGKLREEKVLKNGIKFLVLGHNTIRGAAGGSILNAELFIKTQNLI